MADETGLSLPNAFALQSMRNKKYLRYVYDVEETRGFIQSSNDKVMSPYTKLEVEYAKTGDGASLVHIRSTYNNKYWAVSSPSSRYIVAKASKTEEDQSKDYCTLFKPLYDEERKAFRFRHVQLNSIVHQRQNKADPQYDQCLFANTSMYEDDDSDLFMAFDWSSLVILPKHVAFKGNNGAYLRSYVPYHRRGDAAITILKFTGTDIGDPRVRHEVFTTNDGHVRIKNSRSGKFWAFNADDKYKWIYVNSSEEETDTEKYDPKTLFWPVQIDDNVVALRNIGSNKFCKRLSTDKPYDVLRDCLSSNMDHISDEAKLEVADLAISREIYNVDMKLSEARMYDETPLVMASGVLENKNTVSEKLSLKMSYEDTHTVTWSSTVTYKLGLKFSFEAGVIKVFTGGLELTGEFSEEYSWGGTQQTKTLVEVNHDIVVPPNTKVKVKVVATQGSCNVPFSYTQHEILTDGRSVQHRYDDGICTVVNSYNYQFLTEEEKL